jgi:chorismate synthase
VLGGISDGFDVTMRVAFKPTPSIFKTQDTVTNSKINSKINIRGRHDPAIVPRAVAVVEAMASLTVVDLVFANLFCRMDKIKSFYID